MSYCVNCGVELDSSAKKCALCSTPVINPNFRDEITEDKPFSDDVRLPREIKKRFIAFVISVTMLIPDIVILFLNIFFIRKGFWSIYVITASLLVWVLFVFPWFTKKPHPYLMWGFDTAAVAGFFFTVFRLHGADAWISKSVLSFIALISAAVLIMIIWLRRKKRHWTAFVILLLLESTFVSLFAGMITTFFSGNYNFFIVGIVIAVCAFVMMLFFIYCNSSKHIRAWLNKVFYI